MTEITKSLGSLLTDMGIDGGTQKLLSGSRQIAGSYVTTEVQGLAELERALDALPEKVAKKTLIDAVRDAAELFRVRAASGAPYDPDVAIGHPKWRTLHLREGILKKIMVTNLGAAGSRVRGEVALDKKHAFFGRYIEFGWITARGGKQIAPHPFMRPAFEAMKDPALALFEVRLRAGIEAAARELAR
jgi:HK97 gp10 family phage protein